MARLGGHARNKYTTGTLLGTNAGLGWDGVLAERWRNSAGDLGEVEIRDTEVIVMIDGNLPIRRRGDGRLERCDAVPGTVWLCPDGVREDMIRLYGEVRESLHLFLPAPPPHRYVAERRMERARAMPAEGVALTAERDGDVLWVALVGRLDAASAGGFARALGDAVAGTDRAVVLECGGLRFIGSVGIRALLAAAKSLGRRGGSLVLCAPSEPARRVLRITGFDRFLPIYETREAVRAALRI